MKRRSSKKSNGARPIKAPNKQGGKGRGIFPTGGKCL